MRQGIRRAAIAGAMTLGMLMVAAPAFAGTVRYTVPESSSYSIQDNGNGIVKVFYNGCVTAGERQVLDFSLVTNVGRDSGAVFSVLREEGQSPTAQFDVNGDGTFDEPPRVQLTQGQDQTFAIRLAFSLPSQNNGVTTFRIKLDPDSGEGLGQGAGIMVRIPCVLAAQQQGGSGGRSRGGGISEPTTGSFQETTTPESRRFSPCVAVTRRVRARAGERSKIVVRVRTNSTSIRNSLVRITGPGFVQRRRTGTDGIVSFTVRPRRSGRILIQSDVCFGADRIAVLGARRAQGRSAPRFTG